MSLIPGISDDVVTTHLFPFVAEELRGVCCRLNKLYLSMFKTSLKLIHAVKTYPLVVAGCGHEVTLRVIELLPWGNLSVLRLIVKTRNCVALYKLYNLHVRYAMVFLTDSWSILETIAGCRVHSDLFTQTYMLLYGRSQSLRLESRKDINTVTPTTIKKTDLTKLILHALNNNVKNTFHAHREKIVEKYIIRLIKSRDSCVKQVISGLNYYHYTEIINAFKYAANADVVDIICMAAKQVPISLTPTDYACLIRHNKISLALRAKSEYLVYVAALMGRHDILITLKNKKYQVELCNKLLYGTHYDTKQKYEIEICRGLCDYGRSETRRLLIYLNRIDFFESFMKQVCKIITPPSLNNDDIVDYTSDYLPEAIRLGMCTNHVTSKYFMTKGATITYANLVNPYITSEYSILRTLCLLVKYTTMADFMRYRRDVKVTIPYIHRYYEFKIMKLLARKGYLEEHFQDVPANQYMSTYITAVVAGNTAAKKIFTSKIIAWCEDSNNTYDLQNTNPKDIIRIFG
jgi:hypothetical protein